MLRVLAALVADTTESNASTDEKDVRYGRKRPAGDYSLRAM